MANNDTPGCSSAGTKTAVGELSQPEAEVSTVTLQQKMLPFWRDHARVWFLQFEAIVGAYRPKDETKYRLVLSVLSQTELQQVTDILMKPPDANKYEALKDRLITVYEESETQQFQKLLHDIELGDQKPSQLLRRMRDLAATKVPDDALRVMWMGHLPAHIRAVLAISDTKLDDLATMADKMMEHTGQHNVAAITQPAPSTSKNSPPTTVSTDKIDLLLAEMSQMKLEIAELRRGRDQQPYRKRTRSRSRGKSHSRPRRTPVQYGGPDWLCFYHRRFGDRAHQCVEPCARRKTSEN